MKENLESKPSVDGYTQRSSESLYLGIGGEVEIHGPLVNGRVKEVKKILGRDGFQIEGNFFRKRALDVTIKQEGSDFIAFFKIENPYQFIKKIEHFESQEEILKDYVTGTGTFRYGDIVLKGEFNNLVPHGLVEISVNNEKGEEGLRFLEKEFTWGSQLSFLSNCKKGELKALFDKGKITDRGILEYVKREFVRIEKPQEMTQEKIEKIDFIHYLFDHNDKSGKTWMGQVNEDNKLDGDNCQFTTIWRKPKFEKVEYKGKFSNGEIEMGTYLLKQENESWIYEGEFRDEGKATGKGKISQFKNGSLQQITEGVFVDGVVSNLEKYSIIEYSDKNKVKTEVFPALDGVQVVEKYFKDFENGVEEFRKIENNSELLDNENENVGGGGEIVDQRIWEAGESAGMYKEKFNFFKKFSLQKTILRKQTRQLGEGCGQTKYLQESAKKLCFQKLREGNLRRFRAIGLIGAGAMLKEAMLN